MGKYDGVISDNGDYENQVKFNMNDFHWSNDNMININKNLKFILHKSQYSDKFSILNDTLDINKDKIEINVKSIIPLDQATGAPNSIISVDNNDKLKLNLSSDFMTLNNSLYCNLGAGLTRDDQNRITIALAKCNLKFVNNQLCFDTSALIDNFNCIKLDDKQRLRLDYNVDDFTKSSAGKLYVKIYDKHIKRTQNGLVINIDNDTIRYDTNQSKLISSIDKYVVPQYSQNGDIYIDQTNKKMKLNINNYVNDQIGSKIVMGTDNKITTNITNDQSGTVYFNSSNKLDIRLGRFFSRDSSGHFFAHLNENGLNWNNFKISLNIFEPLLFNNDKKLTLGYTPYFKLSSDNKLDIDINKLTTDVVIPGEGIKLNNDRSLSIDRNILTSLINVSALSGLKIVGNQLIVDEPLMSSNLIRLNSNSPIKRRVNNYYEIETDRLSIDTDYTTGALKVKDSYITNVITSDYIKNKVQNESYFKDLLKFQGPAILKRCALCWWDLDCVADTDKSIAINTVSIEKLHNQQHKFDDFYYFVTENNPTYYYKHYSMAIFNTVINDNYIHFNNTHQRIKYTDIFYKSKSLKSIMFNFVIEPEKKIIDINSTLMQSEIYNYIKILYNNQGIVFKFGLMYEDYPTTSIPYNEIIVPTTESLLRKNVITFYYSVSPKRLYIIVNGSIIYDKNNVIIGGSDVTAGINTSLFGTYKYHDFYIGNNSDYTESYNGKMYDYSMLQNISEQEALNLHEYYKYIHNI